MYGVYNDKVHTCMECAMTRCIHVCMCDVYNDKVHTCMVCSMTRCIHHMCVVFNDKQPSKQL